jgi:hypothetical protein
MKHITQDVTQRNILAKWFFEMKIFNLLISSLSMGHLNLNDSLRQV